LYKLTVLKHVMHHFMLV